MIGEDTASEGREMIGEGTASEGREMIGEDTASEGRQECAHANQRVSKGTHPPF